jgi:hypothetical protein
MSVVAYAVEPVIIHGPELSTDAETVTVTGPASG